MIKDVWLMIKDGWTNGLELYIFGWYYKVLFYVIYICICGYVSKIYEIEMNWIELRSNE